MFQEIASERAATILLVDDHPLIHEVVAALARRVFPKADMLFAHDLAGALQQASVVDQLDLVLLDLGLPGCSGIEAVSVFRDAYPKAKIVVISATEDRAAILKALAAGVAGYLPKTHTPPLMGAALKVVAEGGTYVPPQVVTAPEKKFRPDREARELTKRQLDVLRLIAKGFANKQIARRLRIARDTVKHHSRAIYAVLGVANRTQAARAAERRGIKLD